MTGRSSGTAIVFGNPRRRRVPQDDGSPRPLGGRHRTGQLSAGPPHRAQVGKDGPLRCRSQMPGPHSHHRHLHFLQVIHCQGY